MTSKVVFVLITTFWLVMNTLLIRQEFGSGKNFGSPVPVEVVWRKVLTAPDNSSLTIYQRRNKIGFCRWSAAITEAPAVKVDELGPEGRVENVTGYNIGFEGNVFFGEITNRLRFDATLKFSTNNSWRSISLRAGLKPNAWELYGNAEAQEFQLKFDG